MQYICSEKPVFLLKKANAVPLAKSPHCIRIVFANAPYCVFSLTTHLSVMLNLFQHLTASLYFSPSSARSWNLRLNERKAKLAWAMPSVSKLNSVKQVIRFCSSITSFICIKEWSGWRRGTGSPSSFTAHRLSLKSPHRGGDLEGVFPPQQRSIRRLSGGIHADLCRARVII